MIAIMFVDYDPIGLDFIRFKDGQALIQHLTPLLDGWVRLTHFTNQTAANGILKNGLKIPRIGIDTTSDVYRDSDELLKVLETGRIGNFDRNSFGDYVVIFDLDNNEQKNLRKPTSVESIPVSNIVGVVKRVLHADGSYSFEFKMNKDYRPVEILSQQVATSSHRGSRPNASTPPPQDGQLSQTAGGTVALVDGPDTEDNDTW